MIPLFSTAYLPPISYVAAMAQYAEVQIEAKETFPKQTYRNRALIMTAGGVRPLSVPTVRTNHSRADEVMIDRRDRWAVVHFRTLQAAYAASPYWEHYSDELQRLLYADCERLVDFNLALTQWILRKLKCNCTLSFTSDFLPPSEHELDYRYRFSPKKERTAIPRYYQVFEATQPFAPDLSAVDLLMNLGPDAAAYLKSVLMRGNMGRK